MKRYILSIIFMLIFSGLIIPAAAQQQTKSQIHPISSYSITGRIIDSLNQQPVSWATINLKNSANETIKSVTSDSMGVFIIDKMLKGHYELQVVNIGYLNKAVTLELADSLKPVFDVGVLRIQSDSRKLNEVKVEGLRPLVKQEIDKLVYDVKADPDSKSNSVLEMMRKVPFVSLDAEQNILLKNNSSFKIFINGRPSGMVENNPKEVLRSMPASTIEKIEVITNPPAKYDAEGFAGIINIVTIKKPEDGYNGTVNLNGSFPAGGPGMGGSFNFKAGRFVASVFTGGSFSEIPSTGNLLLRDATTSGKLTKLVQDGNHRSDSRTGYFGTDLSYEINSVQLISAQFNINRNKNSRLESQQSSLVTVADNDLTQGYKLRNDYKNYGNNLDASLNYQVGFKTKKDRTVTVSYRYSNYNNESNNVLMLSDIINYPYSNFKQENEAGADEHTIQADYIDKFKNWGLEAGAKAIFRYNISNYDYSSLSIVHDDFNLSQDVFSAYSSLSYNGKNWGLKGGFRMEQTVVGGDISQDYLNIVPSVSLGFKLKGDNNLNFGFSQRLRRAGINRLNPFVDRSNPNSEFSGNPNLKPSSINNIIAGYNRNGKLSVNIGLGYSFFNNLDFRIFTYDPANQITKSTFDNVGKGGAFTTDLYLSYAVTKDLSFNFNGNLIYLDIASDRNIVPALEGIYHNFTVSGSYRPLPSWRLGANINVIGDGPASKSFQAITKGQINTGFSSSHEIIKRKLDFSISMNNPFHKFRNIKTTTTGPDFNEVGVDQSYLRTFRISLNYNFGKLKDQVKRAKRGIKNDDLAN